MLSRKIFWTLIEEPSYENWLSLKWRLNSNKQVNAGDTQGGPEVNMGDL